MIVGLYIALVGAGLMFASPVQRALHRKPDQDVVAGTGEALRQSFPPPQDGFCVDLLTRLDQSDGR